MYDASDFFGQRFVTLLHGSPTTVPKPSLALCRPHNDYGPGFYCTQSFQLASEWACPTLADGYVNEYRLDTAGLALLDLADGSHSVLNWIAVLLANRTFETSLGAMEEARQFVIDNYAVSLEGADLVHGYRADDSYFAFARAFLSNRIGVSGLRKALFEGGLGYQIMLRSEVAFQQLTWAGSTLARGRLWNPPRLERDQRAREAFQALEVESLYNRDDLRIVDLMRGASWDA